MNNSPIESRHRTAAIARSYLDGSISWQDFQENTLREINVRLDSDAPGAARQPRVGFS
jgi:hypothetical protein